MKCGFTTSLISILALLSIIPAWAAPEIQFNQQVHPILSDNCFACHGPDAKQRKKGLELHTETGLLSSTQDGTPLIQPGNPQASAIFQRIIHPDPDKRMPPTDSHLSLSPEEIQRIRQWIEEGAQWQGHWAFSPPQRPEPPTVRKKKWPINEIDHFILSNIEKHKLRSSSEADKETLIRRVTHDLTGLPPTPEEVQTFLNDTSPQAYENMVDRVFDSPRYGEHMALGWLEVARYADTDGYQNDRYRYMHVWRDWVIEAFNTNKPYDEFIIEQLAGDMLPNPTMRQQIATGFGRNHRINSENGSIAAEWLVENVVDRVETFGTTFLALTFNCARCHDHKYDPISQKEFFEVFAQFNRVPEWGVGPNNGNSPPFITIPESWPNLTPEEDRYTKPEPYKLNNNQGFMKRPQAGSPETVMVMEEMEEPRPTYLLNRGLYNDPDTSEELFPSVPEVLLAIDEKAPSNRLELARWLVKPDHPLTARVTVNRIWQHFFGIGLVKTTENFGVQGEFPSHPELLDWLATEFIRLKWDHKAFQKMILMSATYRQDSRVSSKAREIDPENRLLSHGPRIRLSAQQLRDQALYTSGLLAGKIGGPSVKPYMPPGLWESVSNEKYEQGTGDDLYRRSMYTYWRRTTPPPMMTGFNAANREVCTVRTDRTNSPLHALTLMNNTIFVESARHLAERMLAHSTERSIQISHGFQWLTAREPHRKETRALDKAFSRFYAHFQTLPEEATALLETGESPYNAEFDPIELASMTLVASAILNLDEAIMRN